mgnify:CR=1 FL=1
MHNIPEYTVTELSSSIQKTIEREFNWVRVRGEVSDFDVWNGHYFFKLKDENSVLEVRIWKYKASQLKVKPEDGLDVIVTGKLSNYSKGSLYNLIAESVDISGDGSLLKLIEERRKKLSKEGLFDSNRKISIPFLPRNIGVITSPTGAVIEDIKRIIFDRFPARIVLWPVSVQGSNSENQIIQAITGFNEIKNTEDKPDVIIIARGGGSTEDLVTFNGERLVRSIFESKIPIISAIGHESDNSLCDYVADLRVSTPSAAAEAVVPLKVDMLEKIKYTGKNLNKNILRYIEFLYSEISNLNFQLIHPSEKINIMGRNLQISREKLIRAKNAIISLKKYSLETKVSKLKKPSENIKLYSEQLKNLTSIIFTLNEKKMVMAKQRLISLENILKANSYEKILDRGFVLVESPDGSLIRTAEKAINYSNIHLKFMDGYVSVKVDSKIKK